MWPAELEYLLHSKLWQEFGKWMNCFKHIQYCQCSLSLAIINMSRGQDNHGLTFHIVEQPMTFNMVGYATTGP